MGKIIRLPQKIVSKIAAGEVIERPSYAIKELIENAIDAHADSIRVDIEQSGLHRITVTDNGEGMDKKDIELCFLPHTTSKISTEEHLNAVKTLGFRGEALASMAAVSLMTVKSKLRGTTAGTIVTLASGAVEDISPIGMPEGTVVSIEQLFYSLPVRQKFLSQSATESRQIMQILIQFGIAYPHIKFFVTHNKKTILDLPKEIDTRRRIQTLFGSTTGEKLMPITASDGHISLSGFIAKPQIVGRAQPKQYLFVNGRAVRNKQIAQAVKKAYGTLLPPEAQSMFILFVTLPSELVDVNVHPRKEEVHFLLEKEVTKIIMETVSNALVSHQIPFHDARWQRSHEINNPVKEQLLFRDGGTHSFAADVLKDDLIEKDMLVPLKLKKGTVFQIHNLYLVMQTDKGLLIVDQHAAHERILYEQFLLSFKKLKNNSDQYLLKKTLLIDLPVDAALVLKENLSLFSTVGFDIQPFGENTFTVRAVPRLFKDRDIRELLMEYLEEISENGKPHEVDIRTHRMIAYLSCRSAVKAGEKLTKKQAEKLFDDFWKLETKATCPHGRPAYFEMPLDQLHKLFKR